ncbi:MAG: glutamine amidotransferase [Eubacteriales bacterium]|nr:glutamine amidotransferase [Eubacteriales bacterium]
MNTLDICYLYPDLLNLYGDRGNIIALTNRAKWRGYSVDVHYVSIGDSYSADKYDLTFIGGGQDYEQEIIYKDFIEQKGSEIKSAVNAGKVFLCVCGGYQMMGKFYRLQDGKEIEFLGALDMWTIAGDKRLTGNAAIEFEIPNEISDEWGKDSPTRKFAIVGFENHAGRTYHGEGLRPFGRVIKGFGNNGEDGLEGAIYRNVYCSYLHGSLLPKNPKLTDHLLLKALRGRYPEIEGLTELDDTIENAAYSAAYAKII